MNHSSTYKDGYSIHYGFGRLNGFEAVKRAAAAAKRSRNKLAAAKRGKSSGRKTTKKKR